MAAYRPAQGDIVLLTFNPQAGHEQAGRRPALVVSNQSFHRYTGLAIFCPITNQIKDYPLHVKLDERTKTTGEILCEHVKSLDYNARHIAFVETLPDDLLAEVLERIHMSIESL
ncbi:MAG: type II toxin-antitoxin system PemK/MazF family toxin [Clostridia bacterium]|nr:type II toxin-antitoxin system PemK/MazF family toxin [Clostridia bacterium]